jgi:hypothetical protein
MLGGSYESQAAIADCEDTWNWYAEKLQSENATAKRALYPTPGVQVVTQAATGAGRAHFFMQGREFAVIGPTLYEVDHAGVLTNRGTLAEDGHQATISSTGDLTATLFVTSGGNGYVYDLTTETLTQITALNGKATMGEMIDGYYIALDTNTSTMFFSDLGDPLTWTTGLQFAQRSAMPDRWLSMKVVGRFLWMFGEFSTEIWYDAGDLVPFALYPGAPIIPYGIKAPFSPALIGTDVIWLATTPTGRLFVARSQGTQASVISTYPIETALYNYSSPDQAVGTSYSDRGHSFYLLGFDQDRVTWCFDSETQLWHKRGTWEPNNNSYRSWRPRFYAYAFDEHRMLDVAGPTVFRMSADLPTDADGSFIRRVRRAPAISQGNDRIFYSKLELLMEPGIGVAPVEDPPTACFSWLEINS